MGTRQTARKFLYEFCASMPGSFFFTIDATQKGYGYILGYLSKVNEAVNPSALARQLNVSTARISALLKKLENRGFIERIHSEKDARQTIVKITPAGISYIEEKENALLAIIERLLEKVGEADLEAYIRISKKMVAALENNTE